jgi:hypothetical protein
VRERTQIPADVKRAVRQEARFGCCVCGLPIYEYHHIVEHADGGADTADNLMLLCPNDHSLATQGGFPQAEQRRYKSEPYNVRRGYVAGLLAVTQSTCVVEIGRGVLFAGEGAWLTVGGDPLLSLRIAEDGQLLLSVTLYDEADELIAEIADNEWIAGDPKPWDIEAAHRRLKLRLAPRKVALSIDARLEPVRVAGTLWRSKCPIRMTAAGLEVRHVGVAELGLVNQTLGVDTSTGSVSFEPRAGGGLIVSDPDRLQRYVKCANAWRELQAGRVPLSIRRL